MKKKLLFVSLFLISILIISGCEEGQFSKQRDTSNIGKYPVKDSTYNPQDPYEH